MKKKLSGLLLIFVLALGLTGCGNGTPADEFTVHGMGETEAAEKVDPAPASSTQEIKNESGSDATFSDPSEAIVAAVSAGPVAGEVPVSDESPTQENGNAETGTATGSVVTESAETEYVSACEYSIVHDGNYSTEYYVYEESGDVIIWSCCFCGRKLGSIDLGQEVQRQLEFTNQQRAAAGLSPLAWNLAGTVVSDMRAVEIVSDFSHSGFESLSSEDERAIGYVNACGENICMFGLNPESSDAAQYVTDLWMNSEEHRENILNPAYTEVSISVRFEPSTGCLYWVQLFGG